MNFYIGMSIEGLNFNDYNVRTEAEEKLDEMSFFNNIYEAANTMS